MKPIRKILGGLFLLVGFIAALNFLHAQETASTTDAASVTDTNVDWNSMSDLEVELKAIESMPTISAGQFEASGLEGTFYSAQHAPGTENEWPPLPGNWLSLPIWEVDTDLFLIDDLSYDYNAASKVALKANSQKAGGIQAMDEEGGDFSPDFSIPTSGLWLQINGVSNSLAYLTLNGTTQDVEYEILSKTALTNSTWNSESLIWGSSVTNRTATAVAQNNRTKLFFSARSWQDSTGSGIPDWWWVKYFGQDTNVDAYADPDGDGWNNLQEFQNGTDPTVFNMPPTPQLDISFNTNATAILSWLPSPGPVTGYTVTKTDYQTEQTTNYNFSADTDDFEDNLSGDSPYDLIGFGPSEYVTYQIQAHYAGGNSDWSGITWTEPTTPDEVNVIGGPQGSAYVAASPSTLPAGTTAFRLTRIDGYAEEMYGNSAYDTNWDISVLSLTNGLFLIPSYMMASPVDGYGENEYVWWIQTIANGSANSSANEVEPRSYYDGRTQLKQNLVFLLREPNETNSFEINELTDPYEGLHQTPANYVCSQFYDLPDMDYPDSDNLIIDPLRPFEENYLYRNFVFTITNVDNSGDLTTGITADDADHADEITFPTTFFYQSQPTNGAAISALLATNQTQWLCAYPLSLAYGNTNTSFIGFSGQLTFPNTWTLAGNAKNYWGLPFLSAKLAYGSGGSLATTTLSAGNSFSVDNPNVYMETTQPQFQTAEYDFWEAGTDSLPGTTGFSPTNASHMIIWPEGVPFTIAGYAKLAVTNSYYSGVYAYLGQYFDKSYQITNGVVTTNGAGVLSPYGSFFPTNPGPAALITMPDVDTGARGTCTVYCVSLALDKNHDGIMDTSFGGADGTSQSSPMVAWVNSSHIVPGTDGNLDQDVEDPKNLYPNYAAGEITCQRDLENFFRLWICGMPSLPALQGYTVMLSMSPVSGNPAINLYYSCETNGGISYLTDTNIAAIQIGSAYYSDKLATINSSQSCTLQMDDYGNLLYTNYLFEGAGIGEGQLTLTISQNGNTIAQTSVWLDLHDVKDFYERAVITNNMSGAISNWSSSIETVQQPTSSALGEDTNIIVFVHGFDVGDWNWLDDSDTILKRLYWANYQGKFATVQWPDVTISWSAFLTDGFYAFNWSELNAYKASGAMATYLTQLRSRFPNHRLNILAHSQGNAVVSEAIKQGAPFDTYILTQGALPANSYDVNTTNDDDLLIDEYAYPTPEWQPLGYHGAYTNLTGNIVNFFNPLDPALGDWLDDQKYLKPNPNYSYDGTNCWYNKGGSGAYRITDIQESHALVSRSRSQPIGRQGLSSGEIKEGIMSSIIDLNAQFGFNGSTIDEHSAQWTRPIQTSLPYYSEILTEIKPIP